MIPVTLAWRTMNLSPERLVDTEHNELIYRGPVTSAKAGEYS